MPFAIIASIAAYQVLIVLLQLVLYATILTAFGIGGSVATTVAFVALAAAFPFMSLLIFYSKKRFVSWIYTASAYWFGLAAFLFGGAVVFLVSAQILYSRGVYIAPAILGGFAFGAAFLLHLYGTLISGNAGITRISVTLPGLPEAWRGKKVVFVSDLHLGAIRGVRFAAKVARKVLALAPEAVFIGGDLYDGMKDDADKLITPLRPLTTAVPHGVYFVSGNHDAFWNTGVLLAAIRNAGIRILDDEITDLAGIQLLGIGHHTAQNKKDMERILGGMNIDKKRPSILLKHEPNYLRVVEQAGISLDLSGHTHHGQIFPLSYITRYAYDGFDYGLRRIGSLQVYISSGVGTWAQPLRLGTKSEIVQITLT